MISPLLAIYLHYVLDEWFEKDIAPRLHSQGYLIRYADDFVLVFREAHDAYAVFDRLAGRFAEYGLTLHPEKTRLLFFRPPPWGPTGKQRLEPRSFDFLGFNHHWGRSRTGRWVVQQTTARIRGGPGWVTAQAYPTIAALHPDNAQIQDLTPAYGASQSRA